MDLSVRHRGSGAARKDHPNVLDVAVRRADSGPNVNGPLPPRFIRGAADVHVPDPNDFEFSLFEASYFIRLFKSLQNYFEHFRKLLARPALGQGR
jgi:hypothetical protein